MIEQLIEYLVRTHKASRVDVQITYICLLLWKSASCSTAKILNVGNKDLNVDKQTSKISESFDSIS